ncbi:ABC transporter substrate-binding protein [Arthrobacter sp. GMC3]|uniref:ABC transporter substrate-binding protein n=1 Tax=Arthrobacter sp. GMC3 TaxID=2058894 RepID=UPI000CE55ED7|nr:ABC transporter substrate-binding protein [Arthrobacter sp. GMC3]
MKARSSSAIGLAIVSTLFLAACGGPAAPAADSAPEYVKDGTLSLALPEDPGDLNPVVTNKVAAQVVGSFAYDSLIFTDPVTGVVKPYMASAWTDSPSKVTFTLKDGITCADGTTFTAQTAADNFSWIVDPANGSPLKDSVIPADAKASAAGNVVTVETPEASPFLLKIVGSQAMLCDAALKNPKSVSSASNGTGLFTVKEVVPNDHITLERRAGYTWGPDGATTSDTLGVPKTVTIKVVTNASTAANLILSKGLNVATVSGSDEDRVKAANVPSKPTTRLAGQLNFNHFDGLPTADPEVRKALTAAVDLDTYTKIITGGTGVRATSLMAVDPKMCVYDSVKGMLPAFDAKKAESILTAAGWAKNSAGIMEKGGKELTISLYYTNSTDRQSAAAEYLGSQWKSIGVQVKLQGGDANFVITNTVATQDPSKWDVSTLTFQSNTPSIFPAYLTGPVPPKGTNFMSLNNTKYVDLVGKARVASGDGACDLWKQAEQSLFAATDMFPVSVALANTFFNGATSIYDTGSSFIPGSGYRVTK